LLSRKPVPGAITALPNSCSIVQVSATALPRRSMTDTCVVLASGLRSPLSAPAVAPRAAAVEANVPGRKVPARLRLICARREVA
jgi:hypothetical protein